ncbi:MAG: pilin [Patescibacteria group bacterium]
MNREKLTYALLPLVNCGTGPEPCKLSEFLTLLTRIFDYLIVLVVSLAILGIGIGGAYMIIGGASEGQRTEGKSIMFASIWGLVIAVAAWVIVNTILVNLGAGGFTNPLK